HLGQAVWALDADQERPPFRRLTLLSRQGREALPALRAFLADPLATHGHLWAAELLARLGEPEDLDRFLALATDPWVGEAAQAGAARKDRKSTRLNSSHVKISYAVFCLKKKTKAPD